MTTLEHLSHTLYIAVIGGYCIFTVQIELLCVIILWIKLLEIVVLYVCIVQLMQLELFADSIQTLLCG